MIIGLLACGGSDTGPPTRPVPPAVLTLREIGTAAIVMRPATGLGESTQTQGELVTVDRSGDVLLLDPEAGRAWRRTPFYTFPDWGLWVTDQFQGATNWDTEAECLGVLPYAAGQSGDCDGSELQREHASPLHTCQPDDRHRQLHLELRFRQRHRRHNG